MRINETVRTLSFNLLVIGNIPIDVINDVTSSLGSAFSSNVNVLSLSSLPKEFLSPLRGQYRADMINVWLYNEFSEHISNNSYLIALIDEDAYVPGLNFVFGLASPSLHVASVYLSRLKFALRYPRDMRHLIVRVRKEVMHEVGHLLGLEHCPNPLCVMHFSNSIFDTDRKSWMFCNECALKLKQRGIYLNEHFVLRE